MRSKKEVNIEIGANIRAARERAGYTQEELSEVLCITPNHLSAIERGVSGVSLEAMRKLCRLLGVSADYIVFGENAPSTDISCITSQLARVKPEYQPQLRKVLAAFAELSAMAEGGKGKD